MRIVYGTRVPEFDEATIVAVDEISGAVIARIHCPTVGERESSVIEQEVSAAARAGGRSVGLDFSRVTMLPSVGLGMLIKLSSACKQGGGKLVLFGLDDNLQKLLKVSALDRLLTIAPDEAKAIKKLT